jgi:hypothetical protein
VTRGRGLDWRGRRVYGKRVADGGPKRHLPTPWCSARIGFLATRYSWRKPREKDQAWPSEDDGGLVSILGLPVEVEGRMTGDLRWEIEAVGAHCPAGKLSSRPVQSDPGAFDRLEA